jgi:hypothetical protein
MTIRFKRRMGAAADVAELEYCIALHQTCRETRRNATVSSRDVQRLLKSRYGLSLSHYQAIGLVRCLSGGGVTKEPDTRKKPTRRAKRSLALRQSHAATTGVPDQSMSYQEVSLSGNAEEPMSSKDPELAVDSRASARRSSGPPEPTMDLNGEDDPEEYLEYVPMRVVVSSGCMRHRLTLTTAPFLVEVSCRSSPSC